MIIRPRNHASTKYTHDEEALLSELREMREFLGMEADIRAWLETNRIYSFSKPYYHIPETDVFEAATHWMYTPPGTIIVDLWNVDESARSIAEEVGFCCVICGARTAWDKRGKFYNFELDATVFRRQNVPAPAMICRECGIDIPMIFSPWLGDRKRKKVADRLIERASPITTHAAYHRRYCT